MATFVHITAAKFAMPAQKMTGRTRPTTSPASVRLGSTAKAAGATTAANRIAAPSQIEVVTTCQSAAPRVEMFIGAPAAPCH